MYSFAKWLHLMALIVWLGEMLFLSFVVAPSLFRVFPAVEAGRAVAVLFPIYYRIGYGCGVVLVLTGTLFLARGGAGARWGASTMLAAVMLALTLYAGAVVLPRAAVLRPQIHLPNPPLAVTAEFNRVHALAVALNGVVLIGGLALSVLAAGTLRP